MRGLAYDRVTQRLGEVTGYAPPREGGAWRCPAHDDRNPSMTVSNGEGRVLMNCHSQRCSFGAIRDALGLADSDFFDEPQSRTTNKARIVATYPYTDEAGDLLFEVVRFDPKDFRQRRPDGAAGWDWKVAGTRRVPYRLARVVEAAAASGRIFVVEGEKDVEALEAAGEVATCNPGGAGKWRPEFAEHLLGAGEVVIVRDKDPAGLKHAADVEASLVGKVERVVVVEAATGKDAAEHLGAGHTPDDFRVVDEERLVVREEPPPAPAPDLFRLRSAAEIAASVPTLDWLVRGMLADPTYGQVAGELKSLKTYVSMMLWIGVAAGVPIFDHFKPVEARPVVVYFGEGGMKPTDSRLQRVARSMGVDLASIPLFTSHDVAPIQSMVFQESLARDLRDVRPGLVGLDPLYAFHGTQTKASDLHQEGALLSPLSAKVGDAGASLMIVNHYNQTGTGSGLKRITMAGSGEWSDSWVLLSHRETPDVAGGEYRLLLEIGSRQWGGSAWHLDMHLGVFDEETGDHAGDITWDLVRAAGAQKGRDAVTDAKVAKLRDHIAEVLADRAWELTKTEVLDAVGGNRKQARKTFDQMFEEERIHYVEMHRAEARGSKKRPLWANSHEPEPLDLVRVAERED